MNFFRQVILELSKSFFGIVTIILISFIIIIYCFIDISSFNEWRELSYLRETIGLSTNSCELLGYNSNGIRYLSSDEFAWHLRFRDNIAEIPTSMFRSGSDGYYDEVERTMEKLLSKSINVPENGALFRKDTKFGIPWFYLIKGCNTNELYIYMDIWIKAIDFSVLKIR